MINDTLNLAGLARNIEDLNRHLNFAKETIESGWNARDDRTRAFNFQASLKTIESVILEQDFLAERLYKLASNTPKRKPE